MKNTQMLIGAVLWWISASPALAAPQTEVKPERRATSEVEAASRALATLSARLAELQVQVREAIEQARASETAEEEAAFSERVLALNEELASVAAEFAERAAALRDATDPTKSRILAALRLPDLDEVENELEAIESELEKRENADVSRRMLGLVTYYIADTMRERAERMARSNRDDRRAAGIYSRASKKFGKVLDHVDVSVPEIGSSLHAAALHRIAHAEAILSAGYTALVKRGHNARSSRSKAQTHWKRASHALAELERLHADKRYANRRSILEAAKSDVRRLVR